MTVTQDFSADNKTCDEQVRLDEDGQRIKNWKRWGPYLAERQWGTVREDYSPDGTSWTYFSHDHARSRAYRWGEDGLLGICDRQGRLCFSLALWNEQDPFLKERLFGLTGPQGNHGEDVKELYYYLDSTPTHSYMKALYKYPQSEFPYQDLVDENGRRGKTDDEYELLDTGVFDDNRYFDVFAEYAKSDPNDILIRITAFNRGPTAAPLHLLPTLWFRNTWSHGRSGEGYWPKPRIERVSARQLVTQHAALDDFVLNVGLGNDGTAPSLLLTENETNSERVFKQPNEHPYVKDSINDFVTLGRRNGLHPGGRGTKAAAHFKTIIGPGESFTMRLRLTKRELPVANQEIDDKAFDGVFQQRVEEANHFYKKKMPEECSKDEQRVMRQGYAGLLWTKQFYNYSVQDWIDGDPIQPAPPQSRKKGRNRDWKHLYNRDVISMPDKWEYPWYAAWDLAFHMIPFAKIDPQFAKDQLILFLREWYMHPNGQIPAYEFAFSDVNPPVHAWAVWRVYKMTAKRGKRDRVFLARAFQKLLLNFTWWINRKDRDGNHIFSGGFLGLDNIGVFDRSRPTPLGGHLDQADATAWMGFYCATMLSMALELASEDPSYEDLASKFFEHFVSIADAINTFGGTGLWDDEDGFYYDHLRRGDENIPLRVRSMVGLLPLMTVEILDESAIVKLKGFYKRMRWFLENRRDLAQQISYMDKQHEQSALLLAIPSKEKLMSLLKYVLDENEFLSPHGIRSLSKAHENEPFKIVLGSEEYSVGYVSGESDSYLFGGNSNWRGPVWFPLNFLIVEALERYHLFYGGDTRVECPVGSGKMLNLKEVADEISKRLVSLFLPDSNQRLPTHGQENRYATDPHWKDLVLFYEYFDGDSGKGLGASHQTGWTALVLRCIEKLQAKK